MAAIAFLASLVIVGVPASLLKLACCFTLLGRDFIGRAKLLAMSICAGAVSGLAAILLYFGLPIPDTVLVLKAITIPEIAATLLLIGMAVALDIRVYRYCRFASLPTDTGWRRHAWLVGSNLWIPWAIILLFTYSSGEFLTACSGLGAMKSTDEAWKVCWDAPRAYWSEHSDTYEAALQAGRLID